MLCFSTSLIFNKYRLKYFKKKLARLNLGSIFALVFTKGH